MSYKPRSDRDDFPDVTTLARGAMDAARAVVPPEFGVAILWTFEYGGAGKRLGWIATAEREDMLVMLMEWLSNQDPVMVRRAQERIAREQRERGG